jgi:hypothetical protein
MQLMSAFGRKSFMFLKAIDPRLFAKNKQPMGFSTTAKRKTAKR